MASESKEKFFLVMVLLWFFISYALLWFIGGACTNIFSGGTCISSGTLDGLRNVPIIGSLFPYDNWVSIMYFFAPVAGFILCYFAIKWFNEYFDTKLASSIIFFVLLVVALYLGYLVNLYWYYGNNAALISQSNGINVAVYFCFNENSCSKDVSAINQEYLQQAQSGQTTEVKQFLAVNYWPELRKSMYLEFMLGAMAAWIPFFLFGFYDKRKEAK
ncbi:MAG: hypothetical protein WC308_00420 [archaeon]